MPDGTLLIRALEAGVQAVAKENSQASCRLAQSRAALQVDELPQPASIWDFSQCLLAEAETLVLMSSSAASPADAVPLKLKVIEAGDDDDDDNNNNNNNNNAGKKPGQEVGSTGIRALVDQHPKCPANRFGVKVAVVRESSASGVTLGKASATKQPTGGTVDPKGIANKNAR